MVVDPLCARGCRIWKFQTVQRMWGALASAVATWPQALPASGALDRALATRRSLQGTPDSEAQQARIWDERRRPW
eukprot:4422098-Lingulodinium_polyedra.AAC.1